MNTSTSLLRNLSADDGDVTADQAVCTHVEFWLCAVTMASLCVLGLLGNMTSLFVLGRHKAEPTSIFILQVLTVSDIVLLASSLVVYVPNNIVDKPPALLKIIQEYTWPVSLIAHTVTVWSTVLLTYNRYHAVVKLVRTASSLARMRVKVTILVLLSILYNVPRFLEHQLEVEQEASSPAVSSQLNSTNNVTQASETKQLGELMLYQIIYSIVLYYPVMYIVPFICLAYLNTKLMFALKNIKKKRQAITGHKAKEDHVTLIVVVIVISFVACQTPALVNQIFWATVEYEDINRCGSFYFYYTRISDLLVVLNSSTNFLIYCLFGKTFRDVFLYTICPKSRQNPNEVTVTRPKSININKASYV